MKKTLIIILFIITTINLSAQLQRTEVFSQNFQWLHTVPIESSSNIAALKTALIIDNNNNLIFSGLDSSKTNQGYGDVFIQKISQDGNIIDEIVIQGKGQSPDKFNVDTDNNLYFIIQYEDENLTWGTNTIEAYSSINHALVKLNESLDIVWVQYFEDKFSYNSSKYFIIRNGYIYMQLQEGFEITSVVKMDLDGNMLLEIFNEGVSYFSTIDVDDDGNIYATGSCAEPDAMFNGASFPPPFNYNTWIVKYNQAGEALWVKYIFEVTCNNSLIKVSDPDHIYFSGVLDTETAFDNINLNGPEWVYDFFLARLNSDGEFLWATEVPEVLSGDACVSTTPNTDVSHFMEVDEEQNIYLTGFTRGTIDWGNGVVSQSTENLDVLLWSYDESGNIRYAETAGGGYWDKGQSIVMDNIGNIYMSGVVSDTSTFGEIVHEGTGEFSFLTRYGYETTGVINSKLLDDIHIYPNPTSGVFTINNRGITIDQLSISDVSGKLIIEKHDMQQNETIDISNFENGIYLICIQTENGCLTKKIIKN